MVSFCVRNDLAVLVSENTGPNRPKGAIGPTGDEKAPKYDQDGINAEDCTQST